MRREPTSSYVFDTINASTAEIPHSCVFAYFPPVKSKRELPLLRKKQSHVYSLFDTRLLGKITYSNPDVSG